jgi:hypothetical protein
MQSKFQQMGWVHQRENASAVWVNIDPSRLYWFAFPAVVNTDVSFQQKLKAGWQSRKPWIWGPETGMLFFALIV